MITNDDELTVVRRQLARCESIIDSFRKELLPHNERNFKLYAGPWLDFRDQFQADIDAYLSGRTQPRADDAGRPAEAETPTVDRV